MKIHVGLLNYQEKNSNVFDLLPSINQEEHTVNAYEYDYKGIGNACNKVLHDAFEKEGADYCLILANDIQEPANAIQLRLNAIKNTDGKVGIVTIPCDRQTKRESIWLASNFMISRELFENIGYFTIEYDENGYGPVDLQYCTRSYLAGFKNINVLGSRSVHLDNGDKAYGYSKREVLNKTYPKFNAWYNNIIAHPKPNVYLPYEQS